MEVIGYEAIRVGLSPLVVWGRPALFSGVRCIPMLGVGDLLRSLLVGVLLRFRPDSWGRLRVASRLESLLRLEPWLEAAARALRSWLASLFRLASRLSVWC